MLAAIERKPADSRIRDLLIDLYSAKGQMAEAIKVALDGVRADPTSWRMHKHAARLIRNSGGSLDAVRGHYEAALRHRKRDLNLLIECAAFLYMQGDTAAAAEQFNLADTSDYPAFEKRKTRDIWRSATGDRRRFHGKVSKMRGASAVLIALPENIEAMFYANRLTTDLHIGDEVSFCVAFNAKGPIAVSVQRKG